MIQVYPQNVSLITIKDKSSSVDVIFKNRESVVEKNISVFNSDKFYFDFDTVTVPPDFPVSSTLYIGDNFTLTDPVTGEYYVTDQGWGILGYTDESGALTIGVSSSFSLIAPTSGSIYRSIDSPTITYNKLFNSTNIKVYYDINSTGVYTFVEEVEATGSYVFDIASTGVVLDDVISIKIEDVITGAYFSLDINIKEVTIEITSPSDLSSLKIDENIEIEWDTVHTSEVDIYVAYDGGDFELVATTSLTYFTLAPESASSLSIKVVDSGNSNIYDSVNVTMQSAFVTISEPLSFSDILIGQSFTISGTSNAETVNIKAIKTDSSIYMLANSVNVISGSYTSSCVLSITEFFNNDIVQIIVTDSADNTNSDSVYIRAKQPLEIEITSPATGTEYNKNDTVTIEGTSTDTYAKVYYGTIFQVVEVVGGIWTASFLASTSGNKTIIAKCLNNILITDSISVKVIDADMVCGVSWYLPVTDSIVPYNKAVRLSGYSTDSEVKITIEAVEYTVSTDTEGYFYLDYIFTSEATFECLVECVSDSTITDTLTLTAQTFSVEITKPLDSEALAIDVPFTIEGTSNDSEILLTIGSTEYSATVINGSWKIEGLGSSITGNYTITAKCYHDQMTQDSINITLGALTPSLAIVSPVTGDIELDTYFTVSGTATGLYTGAEIEIYFVQDSFVIATAEVDSSGNWATQVYVNSGFFQNNITNTFNLKAVWESSESSEITYNAIFETEPQNFSVINEIETTIYSKFRTYDIKSPVTDILTEILVNFSEESEIDSPETSITTEIISESHTSEIDSPETSIATEII